VDELEQERLEIKRLTVGKRIISFDSGVYGNALNLYSITLDDGTTIYFSADNYDNIVTVRIS